eukprot:TRINITY_DN39222_c0_g1_i1.p2 TRINITY_DN39222_c0_g1~~TRINITY_DN39222_c0_g1_i1.p2  ORF type:complete len:104 (+),score=17.62 TRINITY_DN39222_c0_g1_i1:473-784(+)
MEMAWPEAERSADRLHCMHAGGLHVPSTMVVEEGGAVVGEPVLKHGEAVLQKTDVEQLTKNISTRKIRNRPCVPVDYDATQRASFWYFPDSGVVQQAPWHVGI